jgi:predicted choloylglycine hydrolase
MSPEHREEILALADASGLDHRTALLANCFLDMSETVACSTVSFPASASPDGVARMGRNLDFPGLQILDSMSAVLIFHPADGRYQFAAITWPGLAGVLSGMNEHGLVLCNMEVTRSPRLPSAMPYALLYRTVLERCRDVDEAVALLQNTPRQSANNLMLMDAAGKRAVIELTPEAVTVRHGADDAALISTNHQRGQDTESPGRCERYDYLHATSAEEFGKIGVEQIEHMLAGAMQGKWSIQSMVFEPSNRVIYLATGTKAPTTHFYRIDLKRRFDAPAAAQ